MILKSDFKLFIGFLVVSLFIYFLSFDYLLFSFGSMSVLYLRDLSYYHEIQEKGFILYRMSVDGFRHNKLQVIILFTTMLISSFLLELIDTSLLKNQVQVINDYSKQVKESFIIVKIFLVSSSLTYMVYLIYKSMNSGETFSEIISNANKIIFSFSFLLFLNVAVLYYFLDVYLFINSYSSAIIFSFSLLLIINYFLLKSGWFLTAVKSTQGLRSLLNKNVSEDIQLNIAMHEIGHAMLFHGVMSEVGEDFKVCIKEKTEGDTYGYVSANFKERDWLMQTLSFNYWMVFMFVAGSESEKTFGNGGYSAGAVSDYESLTLYSKMFLKSSPDHVYYQKPSSIYEQDSNYREIVKLKKIAHKVVNEFLLENEVIFRELVDLLMINKTLYYKDVEYLFSKIAPHKDIPEVKFNESKSTY